MAIHTQTKQGDCETCMNTDCQITVHYGNMWMCDECWQKEQNLQAENMKPENQQKRVAEVNRIIEQSQKIDANIQIKSDLFNAATIPALELKAAIEQDETIPVDQKDYAYTKVCAERFQQFQKVVFDQRQELLKNENAMRMWQIQTQTAAGKLRTELREQFKQFDINYQPVTPKTPKPAAPKTGKKAFKKEELAAAIKKYNLDASHGVAVQMLATAKGWSVDEAGKDLAVKLGKYKG